MKRIVFLILCATFCYSCKKITPPRTVNTVKITEFVRDSTSIRAMVAVDENTLYYAGSKGDIGSTSDGGKIWKVTTIKYQDTIVPNFRSIAKNKNGIFALSIGNPALLFKITANNYELVYKEEHEKVFYDSLKFFDDGNTGIAVGDPTDECPSIIITKDGGLSWNKLPCEVLPKFEDGEAFFAASNTNIAIVNHIIWVVSGGKKSRVLKSVDKGQTWQIFNTPFIQGNGPQGMYSVDFINDLQGIAIGGDYSKPKENKNNKAITNDGGRTWNIVANNNSPSYKSCIQYIPNTNGKELMAVGKTGCSFSNNGGETWNEVSNASYYAIQFVNKNEAWLSGNNKIGKMIIK